MTGMKDQKIENDQHFMIDRKVMEKIVSLAGIRKGETILEIGPGHGELTETILEKGCRVIAMESDESLAADLSKKLKARDVEIVTGNALKLIKTTDFDRLVSNPPYSILEALLHVLSGKRFKAAVLSVPKQFAERLIAKPEDPLHSKLSVFSQAFYSVKVVSEIPREAFNPMPDTDSVIITIKKKRKNLAQEFLKMEDRKTKNALMECLCSSYGLTKNQSRERVSKLGMDEKMLEKEVKLLSLQELIQVASKIMSL